MFNKNFLNAVVPGMNKGYRKGVTGKAKIYPLHNEINRGIRNGLGDKFFTYGYGGDNEAECTIRSQSGHWKPDGFFGQKRQVNNGILNGGTIDYKAPYSNIIQNIGNVIGAFRSDAAVVRPEGNLFAGFIMVPEVAPYFTSDGKVRNLEHPVKKFAKELKNYANSDSSYDASPDLIGFVAYRMPGLDFSTIKTKRDYIKAITNYKGDIEFVNVEGVESDDKFIINDPETFVNKYVGMISSRYTENECESEYMKLFSQTPIEEQIKYLVAQGVLAQ